MPTTSANTIVQTLGGTAPVAWLAVLGTLLAILGTYQLNRNRRSANILAIAGLALTAATLSILGAYTILLVAVVALGIAHLSILGAMRRRRTDPAQGVPEHAAQPDEGDDAEADAPAPIIEDEHTQDRSDRIIHAARALAGTLPDRTPAQPAPTTSNTRTIRLATPLDAALIAADPDRANRLAVSLLAQIGEGATITAFIVETPTTDA